MTEAPEAFNETMWGLFEGLSGTIGVAVHEIGGHRTLNWNANETFPMASTMKIPLIYETYRQAEAGRLDLTERVPLSHANRVPGSGVLQHLDEGLAPTIRDLAELMIIVSDNWATDILFDRLGKAELEAMLVELGLSGTYLPLTIRELFATLVGVDPTDPAVTYDTLNEALKTYDPGSNNSAMALDSRNDVSTPNDMVRLLSLIYAGHGLSPAGLDAILGTLRHQNFSSIIPHRLPTDRGIEVAHKTGSLRGVKNDVGIVTAPGVSYAIALMSRGQDDVPEVVDRLARASRWVWDAFSAPAS
jgi:beta-lactamase class A